MGGLGGVGGCGGCRGLPVPGRRVGVATQFSPLVVPDEPLQSSLFALHSRTNSKSSLNVYFKHSLDFTPFSCYPRG